MSFIFFAVATAGLTVDPVVDQFLKDALFDYESAKIEVTLAPRERPVQENGRLPTKKKPATTISIVHCMRINSKNRFGGYIGWRRYYFIVRKESVVFYKNEDESSYQVEEECPSK